MRALADFDPFDPEVVQEPHAFFAALRREAPLYRMPSGAYSLISRYRDVRDAALNTEVFSSNLVAVMMQGLDAPELLAIEGGAARVDVLATADPPGHARQRKLSNKAFSMRRVAALEPAIRALAESLIGAIRPRGGARWSSADWVREVAVPLPMTMIARLIGLPDEDIPQLERWSGAAISVLSGLNTPAQIAEARKAYPDITVIVHPECRFETVQASDLNGSTEFIAKTIANAPAGSKFAVGTEINLVSRLARENPDKTVFCLDPVVCPCSTMYRVHPAYLAWVLEELAEGRVVNEIAVPEETAVKARVALDRMLSVP